MISLKERCNQCSHHATCKYSGDYERFFATLTDKIGKWNSEFIFIPTVELSCKYFAPIKENYKGTRASFTSVDDFVKPIIADEDLKKQVAELTRDLSPCATCLQVSDKSSCCGCDKYFNWKEKLMEDSK